jgi:hypothetical protein
MMALLYLNSFKGNTMKNYQAVLISVVLAAILYYFWYLTSINAI